MAAEVMECCPTSSFDADEMDADECLLAAAVYKANILDDVARSNAFFKSQQRGEEDLTFEQKRSIAETLLDKNCVLFLQRYWKYVNIRDLSFFDDTRSNYEVNYYLEEIKKLSDKKKSQAKIKNRRYEALKKMVSEGSYFSDDEMRRRSPFMYERLIGQHLTEEERIAFKKQEDSNASFSSFLMERIDRNFINHLSKMQEEEEEAVREENDDDSTEEEEEEEDHDDDEEKCDKPRMALRVCDGEKQMLRNEFTNIMYESFLSGNDKEFDYSSVDNNAEYDSVQEREVDEEEKYFDDDDESSECEVL